MHDFRCTDPDDMYYDVLRKRVSYFKRNEEGKKEMCKMMDEMRQEAEKRGEKRGERRGQKKGENKLASLIKALIEDSKQDMIELVTSDVGIRAEYYRKYNIH